MPKLKGKKGKSITNLFTILFTIFYGLLEYVVIIYVLSILIIGGLILFSSSPQQTAKDFTYLTTTAEILLPITFLVSFDVAIKDYKQKRRHNKTINVTYFLIPALVIFILSIVSSFVPELISTATIAMYVSLSICVIILINLSLSYLELFR
ncbi:MAG: hypothetical protein M1164_00670 [Candidatus Marsarchaeota archaeon]|jgi:hypothetical protein|nr:hypothetical protein [Candidatus Marsarchaeota archaeon]